ncbi:MAG: ABC transporter ATP-binding protein [Candidatus Bathyarchaeota archaeon]|nr:MAG: ABC transporter ATP-binding protein [Candidatus Bathyarchaeota archaeon]
MKAFFSALIDKSIPSENQKLAKNITKHLKRHLKTSKLKIDFKEHNAFIFLAADKPLEEPFSPLTLMKIQSRINLLLQEYYTKNESKLQKQLKGKRELKETSQIVKSFLKEIDPKLEKIFDLRLKNLVSELPTQFCELQTNSMTAIWNLSEEREVQFYLSGWKAPFFKASGVKPNANLEPMVDKLAFLNFFCIFLEPTLHRLREMSSVLERLKLGLSGTHYKSSDPDLQTKLEVFLRILSAKLSSLHNMDKTFFRIFTLFNEPTTFFKEHGIIKLSVDLRKAVRQMSLKINQGKSLLTEVQDKLEWCQKKLKAYLDETANDVKPIASIEEFKLALLTMAELSSDLFVEAEISKLWLDFFGSDLPFFTFQSRLFSTQTQETFEASTEHIVSVRGLVKNYRLGQTTVYALRGVDLDIGKGEFVAIVGNSGAGKTTLLNCIAGLDEPDYGVVFFKGENLHQSDDSEKSKARLLDMGFIFQSYALLPHFDTRENVALPADLAGLSDDLKNRVEELLEGVGIDKQAKQYPAQLSGGQMQRVAVARALTNRPAVIFADEPTGDLDSVTGKQVIDLLKKFHEETKTTVVVITHEPDIAAYAERQIIMEDGRITSPSTIKSSRLGKKAESSIPHKESVNGKQGHQSKFILFAFAAQVVFALLSFIMLYQIDQIVHGTLYSYGLHFNETWALPYWTSHRIALGLLLLIIGLNIFLIANIIHRRRNG